MNLHSANTICKYISHRNPSFSNFKLASRNVVISFFASVHHQWGSVAEWLGRRTWILEIPSSSPALTTSWICSRKSLVQLSAAPVHSQLVCLLPVGILNLLSSFHLLLSLALKSPSGEWSITYVCMYVSSQGSCHIAPWKSKILRLVLTKFFSKHCYRKSHFQPSKMASSFVHSSHRYPTIQREPLNKSKIYF